MKPRILGGVLIPVLLLAASCGRDASSPPLAPEEAAPGGEATLSIVSGNGQLGDPGTPLEEPVVVRVTDGGRPLAGAPVRWRLSEGGGRLADAAAVTDAEGYARATWILGDAADASTLDVLVGGSSTSLSALRRMGLVRTDLKLVRVSGDAQTGTAGTVLGEPLVVRVVSARGGAMAGVKVRWEAVGAGVVSADSAVSGADGTVTARWTLGPTGGAQTASASTTGALPVSFVAHAIPTSGEPVTLVRVSGDGQGARVGTVLAAPLVVRAVNASGTPLSGVQVSWSVRTGGGSITPATITTDGSGQAYARWTMGPSGGPGTAVATAPGAAEITFTANAISDANRVAALVKTLGDGQVVCPGCGLREGIRVMAVDSEGNPVPNAPITWTPSAGTLSYSTTVTDATGTAGAGWTLGTTPGVQTLTATSGQASTAFTATASVGGDGVVAFIQMNPGNTGLEPGDTSHVYAVALDTRSRGVTSAVLTWSIDVPGIIEITGVDPVGSYYGRARFRALQFGEVRLTASAGGQSNTIVIRVRPDPMNGGGGGSADPAPDAPGTRTP